MLFTRKSHTDFRLVPTSMTLNGVIIADPRYLCGSWASCYLIDRLGGYWASVPIWGSRGVDRVPDFALRVVHADGTQLDITLWTYGPMWPMVALTCGVKSESLCWRWLRLRALSISSGLMCNLYCSLFDFCAIYFTIKTLLVHCCAPYIGIIWNFSQIIL